MLETNKAIIQELCSALNWRDWDALGKLFAPNYVHRGSSGHDVGLLEVRRTMMEMLVAFPDLQVRLEELVARGPKVLVRWTQWATHLGEFEGIPPTGRRVAWSGVNVFTVLERKIVADPPYWDASVILRQLRTAQ